MYAQMVQGTGKPEPKHIGLSEWEQVLLDRRDEMERRSGILIARPPTGLPILVDGMEKESIDLAELFLINCPGIIALTTVDQIFPKWTRFMASYLSFQWPIQWRAYANWLDTTRQDIGAPGRASKTDLDRFVEMVTFPSTIFALSQPFYQTGTPLLSIEEIGDQENGFERIGNILWETRSMNIVWHITSAEIAAYRPRNRVYN